MACTGNEDLRLATIAACVPNRPEVWAFLLGTVCPAFGIPVDEDLKRRVSRAWHALLKNRFEQLQEAPAGLEDRLLNSVEENKEWASNYMHSVVCREGLAAWYLVTHGPMLDWNKYDGVEMEMDRRMEPLSLSNIFLSLEVMMERDVERPLRCIDVLKMAVCAASEYLKTMETSELNVM